MKMMRICRSLEVLSLDPRKKTKTSGGAGKKSTRRRLELERSAEKMEFSVKMDDDWRYDDEETAKSKYLEFLQNALCRRDIEIVRNTKHSFYCFLTRAEKKLLQGKEEVLVVEKAGYEFGLHESPIPMCVRRSFPAWNPVTQQPVLMFRNRGDQKELGMV